MELIDRIRKRIEQTAEEAHAYVPITRVISEAEVKEILEQEEKKGGWIPASEAPKTGEYILLSFENFSVPMVGRYEEDKNGGAFYIGDELKQYRAIGTLEELKTTMQYVRLAKAHRTVGKAIEECAKLPLKNNVLESRLIQMMIMVHSNVQIVMV